MAFTTQELDNIANAAIDYHMQRGRIKSQTLQDKPLLAAMEGKFKNFPGGKDNITVRVKGVYTTTIQGFEHDDTVSYANPANIKTATFPWKLIHAGISFTMHELLKDGISVVDTADGSGERRHSEREMTALANLLEDKIEDMQEGMDRGMNNMFWRDGSQSSKQVPGITSFILDNPASVTTVGGIDQSTNSWWRNRANTNITLGTDISLLPVVNTLQAEFRQLRRYGGRPNLILAGSDMIERLEKELRSKGNFTLDGFAKGKFDLSTADLVFKGVQIVYDPTLDDLSKSKYAYVLDTNTIFPMVVEGENMKKHNPSRPETKYVFYRAMTWVGGLVCNQRNANGVYAFA
jgi:hypothetical protein